MATKKEIKEILKELNLSEEQMDVFWCDLKDVNWKVKSLMDSGKTWRDLNAFVIKQIPTQKERDLQEIENKRIEKERKEMEEAERERQQQYYEDNFEKYYEDNFESIMIDKIDKKINLTEAELSELAYEYEVEREEGDEGRWTRDITSYIQLRDRNFMINWGRGLTEYQENSFYSQPIEVKKVKKQKLIPEHIETTESWETV